MKLWLMRHGWAGDFSLDPKKERQRPLTAEGRATVRAIAQTMNDLGEIPKAIFCSPFQRTIETADLIGKELGVQVNSVGDLAPVRPMAPAIADLIGSDRMDVGNVRLKRVMLVVHKDNSTPAMNALGGDSKWKDLVMGEVRRVSIDRDSLEWELKWMLKPSDIGREDHES